MTRARDELVSDWRQQLAAAQSAVADSPHSAWLARVRVRLYRFLLACYGDASWSAAPLEETQESSDAAAGALADSLGDVALEGKPAKSLGQIRSVLKAVASAQDDPHAPGPLAGGLAPESWVIVAAASSKLKIGRCCELLRAGGLHARTAYRGDDHMVEVPARQRQQAFEIIERNRGRVLAAPKTPRTQPIPLWCRIAAAAIVSMWVTGLVAWMTLAVVWSLNLPQHNKRPLDYLAMAEFYPIWGSLYVALLTLLLLGMNRRNRPIPAVKRSRKR